jgi:hypothetical protein
MTAEQISLVRSPFQRLGPASNAGDTEIGGGGVDAGGWPTGQAHPLGAERKL